MPIKDYPFTPVSPGFARPILWVRVINPKTNQSIISPAIIDTGADECAFPASVAPALGHSLEAGSRKKITTASGQTMAYSHTSTVEILAVDSQGQPKNMVVHRVPETPVDFTEGLGGFLLGVRNFLSNFVLTINYPRQVFSLRKLTE